MQGRCSCQGTGEPKHTEMFLRGLDCIRKEMGEVLTDSSSQIFALQGSSGQTAFSYPRNRELSRCRASKAVVKEGEARANITLI